ncbi:unnamed protein product [Microthlaspi erraticum]|uniref:Uncharacterized protein n=1 Tax=Microthlaspi erraticum TaxID=1685480 RepID=A0A6D2K504_9BRAS|nr:unnamed protein product [Microthlaspi erraticum]
MRQRGLSGFLRVCEILRLTDEGTSTTPSSTLEPTGSTRTSSGSGGNGGGGGDVFWCQALACTATSEIVRKKRSSLTSCRRVTTAVSPTIMETPASFLNRRKKTPQRAPLY